MPKGVLFDLDGTLLDSAPDFVASLDNLLTKHNRPKLDPEIIRSHVSDGSWKLTSLAFNIDTSDEKCSALREELLKEYESNLLKHGGAFDGIEEMKKNAAPGSPEDFDFFLTAGDNLYPMDSKNPRKDEFARMMDLFLQRESIKDIPIYPVRGNHDCYFNEEHENVELELSKEYPTL